MAKQFHKALRNILLYGKAEDDAIEVTYPSGGEGLVPGTTETIRWDAFGNTGTTILEYSLNNGTTWIGITTTKGAARSFDWNVPGAATVMRWLEFEKELEQEFLHIIFQSSDNH